MANLRRHFNFSAKSSSEAFSMAIAHKLPQNHFDKLSFMSDICDCLDLCCSYIQALNSLCGAGSSLARNLFHTVREVPAYHNISQQFLSVWDEISKVTASASAAVKTETLMMLQEILNSLEMCSDESKMDDIIGESFQAIGTCLCSFIELQCQFSWSTWKSLSKLSKNFSNDSMRQILQWRSFERNQSKMFMNSHLNTNLKKHFSQLFCKVGFPKVNVPEETSQSQFYTSPSIQTHENVAAYSHFGTETSNVEGAKCVWSTSSPLWATSEDSSVPYESTSSEKELSKSTAVPSDLDDVINLLSCTPEEKSPINLNNDNQNYLFFSANNGPMYHLLRKNAGLSQPSNLSPHISWSKGSRDVNHGYDPWIWRTDNMNCSGLPNKPEALNIPDVKPDFWKNNELKKWNACMGETESSSDDSSSAHGPDTDTFCSGLKDHFSNSLYSPLSHGRHNSENSMSGGLENGSNVKKESSLVTRSKISTWPLKQSVSRNSDYQNHEKIEYFKYSQFPFAS